MKYDELSVSTMTDFDRVSYSWALDQCLSKFNSPDRDGENFWDWLSSFPGETIVGYAHSADFNPLSVYYMAGQYKDLGHPVVWISKQCMVVFRVVSQSEPHDPSSDVPGAPNEISEYTGTILSRWAQWFMERIIYTDIMEIDEPISAELALDVLRDVNDYYGDLAADDI